MHTHTHTQQWSPPFVFPLHPLSFAAYMGVMGVCGILDHSGVLFEWRVALPHWLASLYAPRAASSTSASSSTSSSSSLSTSSSSSSAAAAASAPLSLTLYSIRAHDDHHRLYNVNYGFPFTFMDALHGTLGGNVPHLAL
jgi:sterol desaturase/sphingolipid hydroxylase (fatty acid hydroxylase superfamily)